MGKIIQNIHVIHKCQVRTLKRAEILLTIFFRKKLIPHVVQIIHILNEIPAVDQTLLNVIAQQFINVMKVLKCIFLKFVF